MFCQLTIVIILLTDKAQLCFGKSRYAVMDKTSAVFTKKCKRS